MVQTSELEKVIKTLVGHAYPMLDGIPFPVKGRVVRIYELGKLADVQIVEASGQPMASVLPKLRVPSGQTAEVGKEVRVGFYYADPSQPYIDEVL